MRWSRQLQALGQSGWRAGLAIWDRRRSARRRFVAEKLLGYHASSAAGRLALQAFTATEPTRHVHASMPSGSTVDR